MSIKKKFLASCFLLFCLALPAAGQTTQTGSDYIGKRVQLTLSNAPQPVPNASVFVSGNPGPATYYYWIVTQTSLGASSPAGPFQVINAPNTLSGSNFNQISWSTVAGATYDVLRTSNPGPPFGACNCAVATGVSGNSVSDQANALNSYTVNTLDPSTKTVTLQNLNGTLNLGTSSVLLKVCDASTYPGADWSIQLNNALADPTCSWVNGANLTPGVSSATVVIFNGKRVTMPCGTFTGGASVNPVIQVNNFGGLFGFDRNCTVISTNSPTANIVAVNNGANWWRISDFTIQSAVARTAGAGIRVQGGNGVIERMVINPVFDGLTFDTATVSGGNSVRDVQITDGTGSPGPGAGNAWNCGVRNGGVATGTVSGNVFDNVLISMRTAFADAGFCVQDGSDTITISNSQAIANLGGFDSPALHLETVNGGLAPAGTKVIGSTFEGGLTKNGIIHDAGINSEFTNVTSQSSLRGLLVTGGTDITWNGGQFHLNQQEGVRANGGNGINITGAKFSESSQQTTNTFSDIFAAVGLANFALTGIIHKDLASSGKACKFGIEIAAGGSDFYSVTGDINNGNCVTGAISDGGVGAHKTVCNPNGPCYNGPNAGFVGDVSAGRSTTSGAYFFGSNSNLLDYGITTSGKFTFTGGPVVIGTTTATVTVGTGSVTTAGTAVAAGTCQAQTAISIPGALTTDQATSNLNAALPATWQTGIQYKAAEIQSAGNCTIILCNPTAGSITPAATTVRCTVMR